NLESPHFMKCMYCFKQFENESISELGNHIMENYTFCKYFCRYCLYRAYTASHVLVHEYVFHNDQQPSIIQFKNRQGTRREVVMVVDFNKFVLRYVCNIFKCQQFILI
ncbi:C2H2-type domain-containing protein, partial [Aphis craccivora]